jgi:hypothetical protein
MKTKSGAEISTKKVMKQVYEKVHIVDHIRGHPWKLNLPCSCVCFFFLITLFTFFFTHQLFSTWPISFSRANEYSSPRPLLTCLSPVGKEEGLYPKRRNYFTTKYYSTTTRYMTYVFHCLPWWACSQVRSGQVPCVPGTCARVGPDPVSVLCATSLWT